MNRLMRAGGLVALLAVVGVVLGADGDKNPSIKDIMTKAHKGANSILATVGKEIKADEPNWADVQKQSKELVELGTALGKNDPPKGDKASWDKLTKQYLANAKALSEAAEKKDASAAQSAHKKLTGSCMACHRAHKGN